MGVTVIARQRSRRGNPPTPSLRGGKADAAIQGFTVAPGHAANPPWIATPFGLAMTVEGAGEMQGVSWGVGNFYSLAGPY